MRFGQFLGDWRDCCDARRCRFRRSGRTRSRGRQWGGRFDRVRPRRLGGSRPDSLRAKGDHPKRQDEKSGQNQDSGKGGFPEFLQSLFTEGQRARHWLRLGGNPRERARFARSRWGDHGWSGFYLYAWRTGAGRGRTRLFSFAGTLLSGLEILDVEHHFRSTLIAVRRILRHRPLDDVIETRWQFSIEKSCRNGVAVDHLV